jgi:hypothetical protein
LLKNFNLLSFIPLFSGLLIPSFNAIDIVECTDMVDCKPVLTSVDTQTKVSTESGPPTVDLTQFESPTVALQYLIFTRANNAYVIP